MQAWVLILMSFSFIGSSAISTTSVPGFNQQKECEDAGTAVSDKAKNTRYYHVEYVCIKQGPEQVAVKVKATRPH